MCIRTTTTNPTCVSECVLFPVCPGAHTKVVPAASQCVQNFVVQVQIKTAKMMNVVFCGLNMYCFLTVTHKSCVQVYVFITTRFLCNYTLLHKSLLHVHTCGTAHTYMTFIFLM